jgi:hypothetical protein
MVAVVVGVQVDQVVQVELVAGDIIQQVAIIMRMQVYVIPVASDILLDITQVTVPVAALSQQIPTINGLVILSTVQVEIMEVQ